MILEIPEPLVVEALVDLVEALGFTVIFQPALNSLFLNTERDGSAWQAEAAAYRAAFAENPPYDTLRNLVIK